MPSDCAASLLQKRAGMLVVLHKSICGSHPQAASLRMSNGQEEGLELSFSAGFWHVSSSSHCQVMLQFCILCQPLTVCCMLWGHSFGKGTSPARLTYWCSHGSSGTSVGKAGVLWAFEMWAPMLKGMHRLLTQQMTEMLHAGEDVSCVQRSSSSSKCHT